MKHCSPKRRAFKTKRFCKIIHIIISNNAAIINTKKQKFKVCGIDVSRNKRKPLKYDMQDTAKASSQK